MTPSRYVVIAGNTGAGKSTLLRAAAALVKDQDNVACIDEDQLHHQHLQRMFDRPADWALIMQWNFVIERAACLKLAV